MASDDQPLLPPPDEPRALPAPSRSERRTVVIIVGSLVGLLVIAFLIGYFLHYRRERAAEAANEKMRSSLPAVNIVAVKPSTATSELVLPGSITPITEASLYARASGYVERRYVDIGDRVRRSQVLAEIESPELDQQVSQARAAVAQARQQLGQANASVVDARAKLDLARVTAERYRTLLDQDSVSRQDADQRQQEFRSAEASLQSTNASVGAADENVRAADANLRRLVSLQDFEKVRAPFDGIITARNVDVGALISNAGGSLAASALSGATTAA